MMAHVVTGDFNLYDNITWGRQDIYYTGDRTFPPPLRQHATKVAYGDGIFAYDPDTGELKLIHEYRTPGEESILRCKYCHTKALPEDRHCVGCGAPL